MLMQAVISEWVVSLFLNILCKSFHIYNEVIGYSKLIMMLVTIC